MQRSSGAYEAKSLDSETFDLGSTRENPVPRIRGPLPTISVDIDVDFDDATGESPSLPEPRGSDYPSASRSRIWTSED
ncbi:MAG: hypothetical protein U0169_02435 [Polyangiaceae bacterium]